MEGTIIKSTGSWYWIRTEEDKVIKSRIKGKFRLDGKKLTNPVAVGDKVVFRVEENEEETGIINKILSRKNYIARQSTHKRLHLHLLASNIDQAILFVTLKNPKLKPGFIDRFLLMTAPFDIPTYIIVNKADLYNDEDLKLYQGLKHIYEKIGYKVVLISALERENLTILENILKDKISMVSGHSGVGKSTLINALQPDLELKTQEISDSSGKGQHTTTFAEMHPLTFGGYIIDTPGIKSLTFNHLTEMEVAHNFLEFFRTSKNCRFNNCLHINEPHCAVKSSIEDGEISILRYEKYLQIIGEIRDQNYWELNTAL
ncbi:MAG: ribosome small subunit-dependent GTPase A [Saprospiraceae bacterium]